MCSKEDVEKCKQKDLLEQLLKEMTGEFPALSRVFVTERDLFLAHSLKMAAQPRQYHDNPEGTVFKHFKDTKCEEFSYLNP